MVPHCLTVAPKEPPTRCPECEELECEELSLTAAAARRAGLAARSNPAPMFPPVERVVAGSPMAVEARHAPRAAGAMAGCPVATRGDPARGAAPTAIVPAGGSSEAAQTGFVLPRCRQTTSRFRFRLCTALAPVPRRPRGTARSTGAQPAAAQRGQSSHPVGAAAGARPYGWAERKQAHRCLRLDHQSHWLRAKRGRRRFVQKPPTGWPLQAGPGPRRVSGRDQPRRRRVRAAQAAPARQGHRAAQGRAVSRVGVRGVLASERIWRQGSRTPNRAPGSRPPRRR